MYFYNFNHIDTICVCKMSTSQNDENFSDRFLRSRKQLSSLTFRVNTDVQMDEIIRNEDSEDEPYFNHGQQMYKRNNYRNNLAIALGLTVSRQIHFRTITETWPVKPRNEPFIKKPITIKKVSMRLQMELCDWNQHNLIAAIFPDNHTLTCWRPGYEKDVCSIKIECTLTRRVKFNVNGNLLAIGKKDGGFLISNFKYCGDEKIICTISETYCVDFLKITYFEWSINDVLYVGSSNGSIYKYNFMNEKLVNERECFIPNVKKGKKILSIKLSCNEHYLATSGMDSYFRVFTTRNLNMLLQTKLSLPIKCLAWHPWRECLIATPSDPQNGTLKLWNVCKPKHTIEHKLDENNSKIIDCLSFNRLSGELVMTYFDRKNQKFFINVLSSFDKSTELIEWKAGRIPLLLWSGDHQILLASDVQNSYSLWKFFAEKNNSTPKEKNNKNLLFKLDLNGNISSIR